MHFRILNEGESRVIVLRHGTSEPDEGWPKDTISESSYAGIRQLGSRVRAAGLLVTEVVSSPRGRAVISGFAFAEGNARPGESVAPFQTDDDLTDISSVRPKIVTHLKEIAEKQGCTVEQASLRSPNCEINNYLWKQAQAYARTFWAFTTTEQGQTDLLATHGGLADIAIAILRKYDKQDHPGGDWLTKLIDPPEQWLEKGQAVELIFNADGKLVEANYLE